MTSATTSEIALGTAQLGMDYGVANRTGRPDRELAEQILVEAIRAGVRWFDTAQGYGIAEPLLGDVLREHAGSEISVITKLAPATAVADVEAVKEAIGLSRDALGRRPAVVLLHDPTQLNRWHSEAGPALVACREEGLTAAIGVSVYGDQQFAQALRLPGIDVIEVAYNVIDRRIDSAGLMERAEKQGIRVVLRSPFLQGVLLMDPGYRPPWLAFASDRLDAWLQVCVRHGVTPAAAALRFVLDGTHGALVAVGCETLEQLRGILTIAGGRALSAELLEDLRGLSSADPRLVDPTTWPKS